MPTSARVRIVFAALMLAAGRSAAQCPDGTPPPCAAVRRTAPATRATPSPDARARRFMLLPFRNVTRAAAQDWLVTGAPLMLGETLGQFRDLTVVTEEKLSAARRRLSIRADSQPDATQLRRLAEETDGWTAVSGNVYAMGPRLRITVTAVDVPTDRPITQAQTEIAIDADVRQAFDSLTVQLVAPTGARGTRADLAALTTQSSDAYRAYARGVQLFGQSAFRRSQQAFTEAVTLDSTFALAWSGLAYATANANVFSMMDPASSALRASAQSARLGTRLPPRQLETIRSVQNYFNGQLARAKKTLDSLAVTDRDDLAVRGLLAGILLNDTGLDTTGGTLRMASSMNRSMQLAREVLDRDPGQRNVHTMFAMAYAMAGGWWLGERMGVAGEYGSFLATITRLLMPGPDAVFVPVLQDSLVLMPESDFLRLPSAERARLRRRSADAGMEWTERWLLAGPQDAEAHLWASRLSELRDDAPRALRELAVAESLGVQSAWENLPQRHLQLLVRAERRAAAIALADSLSKAGVLGKRTAVPGLDAGRGYGMAAYLLARRWADAGALVASISPPNMGRPLCAVALGELSNSTGEVSGAALRALADTVAHNVVTIAGIKPLAPCLDELVRLVNDSTAGRRAFAGAALLAAADSLQRAGGNDALAYRVAAWAWAVDSALQPRITEREWFVATSRHRTVGRHFLPSTATVEGDSVVFSFHLNADAPIDATAADSSEWSLRADMPGSTSPGAVSLEVTLGAASTGDGASTRLASLRIHRAAEWPIGNRRLHPVSTSMHAEPAGFTLVARGAFVAELRRARPPTVSFSAEPCTTARGGLCGRPSIPVVYR